MTNKPIPYILQTDAVVLFVGTETHTITKKSHPKYTQIVAAIKAAEWDIIDDLVNYQRAFEQYTNGKLKIESGVVTFNGRQLATAIAKRIISLVENELPVDSIVSFMERVLLNPSKRAVDELYRFLELNQLPLTSDGYFLAYKRVQYAKLDLPDHGIVTGDLVDCYTGKKRNNIGDKPQEDRNAVDDDFRNACSFGLHGCSMEYLTSTGYGGRDNPIVVIKVDPADVVSVPLDANGTKFRCCTYEVISFYGNTGDRPEVEQDTLAATPLGDLVKTESRTATVDDMSEIFKLAKGAMTSYNRRRTANSATSKYSVAGKVYYLSGITGCNCTLAQNMVNRVFSNVFLVVDGNNLYATLK